MFQRFFGLERDPFSISPDPAFLYPSDQHRQALAHLKYGLQREGGFILLTGEVGTGKTTLTRLLLEQAPANFRIAYILNARLGVEDLLASICQELGIQNLSESAGHREMVDQIYRNLLQAHTEGRKTLVVIEEAQNLEPEVLETLRLLTNLETNTAKLLHILLVGQPELLDTLRQPSLRQLDQRVISRHHLQPLRDNEVGNYVSHRMKAAGATRTIFQPAAIRELQRHSQGIPRKINLLAERALMGSYAGQKAVVEAPQVKQAAREVFAAPAKAKRANAQLHWWALGGLALVAALVILLPSLTGTDQVPALPDALSTTPKTVSGLEQLVADAPPAQDVAPAEPVALQAVPEPDSEPEPEIAATVFGQLLQLWDLHQPADSVTELCIAAATNQLRCVERSQMTADQLLAINRPALIFSPGQTRLLASADQLDQVQWPADVLYLWSPPAGYDDSVWPGDRNSTVVSWLLPRLEPVSDDATRLITGGHYTEAVSALVAEFQRREGLVADGVLGQNTLMRLNEQGDWPVPTLAPRSN